ncbi:hypothetical protein ACLRDI_21185 [Pseudomonas piscis]|uniref:hypothetical protein n=1 Tax=Pseudomonas piscis TaxID=2614538 RepID=UPI0039A68C40
MKQYVSLFLVAVATPVALIVSICTLEFGGVTTIRQASGVAVLSLLLIVVPALMVFVYSLVSNKK